MRTIAIIPARGGSVRIPRKNIKVFHGKPIICYSIENARACRLFDTVVVSTDDEEIASVAWSAGARVQYRPVDDGTKGTQEVAADLLRMPAYADVSIACVLYATAPMVAPPDLVVGLQGLNAPSTFYVFSVNEAGHDIGGFYWGYGYAFAAGVSLEDTCAHYVMPAERCCDINTPEDWIKAEAMYAAIHS